MSKTRLQLRSQIRRFLRESDIFVEKVNGTADVAITGMGSDPFEVTGTGTLFLSDFNPGDEVKLDNEILEVESVESDTELHTVRAFQSAHTTATVYRVSKRLWTDDSLNTYIDNALQEISDACWNQCPSILDKSDTTDLEQGVDIVDLPEDIRSLRLIQILSPGSTRYFNIQEISVLQKDASLSNWFPWPMVAGGSGKPSALPTAFSVISPTQIEFNAKPPTTVTDGIKFLYRRQITLPDSDAATIDFPDATSLDAAVEYLAASTALLEDKSIEAGRVSQLRSEGERRLQRAIMRWATGRSTAQGSQILLVE